MSAQARRWTAASFGASFAVATSRMAMPRFAAPLVAFALLAEALIACKPAEQTLDPDAELIARQFFEEVRSGGDLNADPHLAHELKNPTSEEQLAMFRAMIPAEPERSIDLQTWDAKTDSIGTTTRLTIVYDYSDRTLIAQTALFKSPGGREPVIVGFQISSHPLPS
jgi:hypothetical protein